MFSFRFEPSYETVTFETVLLTQAWSETLELPTVIAGAFSGISVEALSVKKPNILLLSGEQALFPVVCQDNEMDLSEASLDNSVSVRFLSRLTTA